MEAIHALSILFSPHHLSLSFHTVSFLLDGLRLRNGETLHGLVFLLLRLVLVRLVLVVAVGIDQHPTVECVTVPPRTLAGPRDAIHCRGARRGKGDLQSGLLGILFDELNCDQK